MARVMTPKWGTGAPRRHLPTSKDIFLTHGSGADGIEHSNTGHHPIIHWAVHTIKFYLAQVLSVAKVERSW